MSMANVTDNSHSNRTRCPRCGYDQRGLVESWTEECPLRGVCAECGLEFEWPELLSTKIRKPSWNVEYGRRRAILWRILKTLIMMLRPSRFWSSLKMTHEPRWRRLALFVVVLFLPLYIATIVSNGLAGWILWHDLDLQVKAYNAQRTGQAVASPPLTPMIRAPTGTPAITNPVEAWQAIAWYGAMPLSDTNLWRDYYVVSNGQPWAPLVFHTLSTPRTVLKSRLRMPNDCGPFLKTWLFALLVHALMPIGFVLVPVSRRIACVRWAHVIRIAAYGLIALWLPLLAMILSFLDLTGPAALEYQAMLMMLGLACFLITPVVLLIWWRFAIRHYLRMPHASGLSGGVLAMSVLLLLLGGYFNFILDQWPGAYLLITGQG